MSQEEVFNPPPGARSRRFKHAALAYLTYGVLYEAWSVYTIYARGLPVRGVEYLFMGVGLAIVVSFPWLLYRGHLWFARVLGLAVGLRVLALGLVLSGVAAPSLARRAMGVMARQESPESVYVVALAVSVGALFFILRAAWGPGAGKV